MKNINLEPRLKFFPAPLFAVIMGLSGLTISYQKASHLLNYPEIISQILLFITTTLFIVFSITYLMKFIKYRGVVKKEFNHPIRLNFFPAFSICLLLFSVIYFNISRELSTILWYLGATLHLFFTLYVIRFWIVNNLEIAHSNPAWFIPIVGNVLVPITGIEFVNVEITIFFFSVGIFFWIILFAIIFNRIIFHHQLADKFLPTLFIFIAPAGIGFISYVKISQVLMGADFHLDIFSYFLYDIGLFFTLLVAFMFKEFVKLKFSITWWAYTFPMTAITIATMLMYFLTKSNSMYILSNILIVLTTFIILFVTYKTFLAGFKKDICIPE